MAVGLDTVVYSLLKKYTDNSIRGITGALAGKNCTIESVSKQDGLTTVTFKWTADDGTVRRNQIEVEDGTPIYTWTSGNHYEYGDLVIYASMFYRCITDNSDEEFDDTKWNELGSPDGNYDIVQNVADLPTRFTAADRKLYYVINDSDFYLWNGHAWVKVMSNSLEELEDVDLDNPAEGDVLTWDETAGGWVNGKGLLQYSTMPTASASLEGRVVQFVGETTADFINGFTYKCILDGVDYVWENVPTSNLGKKVFIGTKAPISIIDGVFIHTNGDYYSSSNWKVAKINVTAGDTIKFGGILPAIPANVKSKYRYAFYDTDVTSGNYQETMTANHCVLIADCDGGEDIGKSSDTITWNEILPIPKGAVCCLITIHKNNVDSVFSYKSISYEDLNNSCASVSDINNISTDLLISFKDLGITKNTILDIVSKYTGNVKPSVVGKTSMFESMSYHIGGDGNYKRNTIRIPYELQKEENTITITVPNGTTLDIKEMSVKFVEENGVAYGPLLKCHNGFLAPENTIPAFEWAGKLGYERLITQFYTTSDNVIVCIHDPSINRTARNADGTQISETVNVADHTYAELCEYDYGIKRGVYWANTKLPTLEEFLDICGAYGMAPEFSMHTADIGSNNWAKIKNMLETRGLLDKTIFKAFRSDFLQYAYDTFGNEIAGYGFDVSANGDVATAIQGFESVIGQDFSKKKFIELQRDNVTLANVEAVREAGYICSVWDITNAWTPDDYARVISYGVSEFTDDWNCQQGMMWIGDEYLQAGTITPKRNRFPYLVEISSLPTASATYVNKTYLLTSDQTGYFKGGIYQCVSDGAQSPTYSWELISGSNEFYGTEEEWNALTEAEQNRYDFVRTHGDEEVINLGKYLEKVTVMPQANAENLNRVVLLVANQSGYNVGCMYKCVSDGSDPATYSWELIGFNSATLGTAAFKNSTDRVAPNNTALVESQSVYSAINTALSSIYSPRGDITCAELTSDLLIAANVGNIYETSDSGTTTALFLQGAGVPISEGSNVGIISAGQGRILFNLMANAFDLTGYQKTDLAQTVEGQTTVEGALGALSTNKASKVSSATAGDIATLDANGNLVDSGKTISDVVPLIRIDTTSDSATHGYYKIFEGSTVTASTREVYITGTLHNDSSTPIESSHTQVDLSVRMNKDGASFNGFVSNLPSGFDIVAVGNGTNSYGIYIKAQGAWLKARLKVTANIIGSSSDIITNPTCVASISESVQTNYSDSWSKTDKQPKTLDTPLTIGGASKTTVESALQAITDRVGGFVSDSNVSVFAYNHFQLHVRAGYVDIYKDNVKLYTLSPTDTYSTSETKTNKVWIDDKPIYRKVYSGLSMGAPGNSWQSWSVTLPSNVGMLTDSIVLRNDKTHCADVCTKLNPTEGTVDYLNHTFNNSTGDIKLVIEYTKTTD